MQVGKEIHEVSYKITKDHEAFEYHPLTHRISLLTPVGEHRKTHIQPSRGKKRKRTTNAPQDNTPAPPPPAIKAHILIGLNSVTRHLEAQAAATAPPTLPAYAAATCKNASSPEPTVKNTSTSSNHLTSIILTHPHPSLSPSHTHIPTLLHLATLRQSLGKPAEPTRLITLPTSTDSRFASALHIPRVGAIGVFEGAPGARAFEEYVREHVGLTECAWVEEALGAGWRGVDVREA